MSHGPRPLTLASALLGIPSMLLFDYETHRAFCSWSSHMVSCRSPLPSSPAHGFRHGIRSYAGLKEDVSAASLRPDPTILTTLGLSGEDVLVTIRPPADEAHYHNPEAQSLLTDVVQFLGEKPYVPMVILPSTAAGSVNSCSAAGRDGATTGTSSFRRRRWTAWTSCGCWTWS